MPTSNGQVTARDIRQSSVKSLHIVDDAVVTEKIEDLAVTFPDKIDDPIWVTSFFDIVWHNVTLTTTPTAWGEITLDIPAWVDQVTVLGIGGVQITNSSGAAVELVADVDIGSEDSGGRTQTVANNAVGRITPFNSASLVGVAGSTLSITLDAWLSSGTNSSNLGHLTGIAIGHR